MWRRPAWTFSPSPSAPCTGACGASPSWISNASSRLIEHWASPLVIHGGTGLSDDQFRRLIANGIAKINHYTALSDAAAVVRKQATADASGAFTSLMRGVPGAIAAEAERCMRLWEAAGRAEELLASCTPWLPVEHLIVCNVKGLDRPGVEAMMAEGRRTLGAIPGVRAVLTGEAVKHDSAYRCTWLVRFCHPAVIDSCRGHPDHLAFADNLFRPVAGECISIDYQAIESQRPTNPAPLR